MAEIRINGLANTAQTAANDDYVALDGATNGTRKMLASKLTEGIEQQLATTNQNVAKNTEDITDLKSDLSHVELFTEQAKTALLNCLAHVAYLDNDSDYYGALEDALYPEEYPKITVLFNRGTAKVYPFDSLDVLKPLLTVLYWTDEETSTQITNYVLSGSLEHNTNIITVVYGQLTTTFNVVTDGCELSVAMRYLAWNLSTGGYRYATIMTAGVDGRRCMTVPIKIDRNYRFFAVDTDKYAIQAGECSTDVLETHHGSQQDYQGYTLSSNTAYTSGWTNEYTTTHQQYVMISFKRMDNIDFTEEELSGLFGTIVSAVAV